MLLFGWQVPTPTVPLGPSSPSTTEEKVLYPRLLRKWETILVAPRSQLQLMADALAEWQTAEVIHETSNNLEARNIAVSKP